MSKKEKVDFNNPSDFKSIVNEIASAKTGKKVKVNLKLVVALVVYVSVCGLALNVYWLVKLILNLF
jgi:hypothetical protein